MPLVEEHGTEERAEAVRKTRRDRQESPRSFPPGPSPCRPRAKGCASCQVGAARTSRRRKTVSNSSR